MAEDEATPILVTDASVLINFLRIEQLDILCGYPAAILITRHVADEISEFYPSQRALFEQALADNLIQIIPPTTDAENDLFSELMGDGRLGIGECSAIAHAITHGCALAMDDRRANARASELRPEILLLGTHDIVVHAIRRGELTVHAADDIKAVWAENHRFRLRFNSFADIV
mgnify:CR=1 FL=1